MLMTVAFTWPAPAFPCDTCRKGTAEAEAMPAQYQGVLDAPALEELGKGKARTRHYYLADQLLLRRPTMP